MSDYKQKHLEKKQEIIDCLSNAQKFLAENEFEHEAEVIRDHQKNLENGEFSIAVVGEFSAGKSTFLNALMGERILPSFTNETTATVNFLRHKNAARNGECGEVVYNDKTSEKIYSADLQTVSKYVCTNSDVEVAKNVDHLDLYLDSKFLDGNVTLVDTPGLNGIAEGHKEMTMQQIERSSAGIFMFNANKPGSRSDFEFLSELRKNVDGSSILLLLNKIDTIKVSEGETVETVIDKLKENYKKVYPDVKTIPEIWPVAAYPALIARSAQNNFDYNGKNGNFTKEEKEKLEERSQMKAFEDRLWKFLTQGEKAKQELLAPVRQLIAQLSEIEGNIKIQLDVLNGSVDHDSIREQILELDKKREGLQDKLDEQTKGMKKDVVEAENDFFHEIRTEVERFKASYVQTISEFEDIEEVDPVNVENYIKKKFSDIAGDAYENYCGRIRDIMANNVAEITDELNRTFSESLNIKISSGLEIKSAKVGIEDFEKACDDYKRQIAEQEQIINEAEKDLIKAMAANRKKASLEKRLASKQEAMESFERDSQMYLPQARILKKPEVIKLGWFRKKQIKEIEILDTSERDQYMAGQERIRQGYAEEIGRLENELAGIADDEVEAKQRAFDRKESKRNELRAELNAYQTEFAEKVKKKYKTSLDNAKKTIAHYLEDVKEDYIKDTKKEFQGKHKTQLAIMEQLVGQSVITKLDTIKRERENLESKLKDAVEERDLSVSRLAEQMAGIKAHLKNALDLESEINDIYIRVDVIKEQEI